MRGYLGLGSNVGDSRANMESAVAALTKHGVQVVASSSVYETEPVGDILDQPNFLNACVQIETELRPEELLDQCKAIEAEMGRALGGVRHAPRPIDIDLLILGESPYVSERLTVPHPEIGNRRFVLAPLFELDSELDIAMQGKVTDLLAALPADEQEVQQTGPPLI